MTLPSKSAIAGYWLEDDRLYHEHGILMDWGEPSCWACGDGWDGRYDVKQRNLSFSQLMALWEKAPLQRCHIVASSIGGSDDVPNLVLMCAECHDLAPNTTDRSLLFRWMRQQNWFSRKVDKLKKALRDFGIDSSNEDSMRELANILESPQFKEWATDRTALHWRQLPPYGNGVSFSTFIGAALLYSQEVLQSPLLKHETSVTP